MSYPFNEIIDAFFKRFIFPILSENYYTPQTLTDSGEYQFIYDFVFDSIRNTDLFICDLSDRNPNVIYELGLANAWGKPTIVFVNKNSDYRHAESSYGHNIIYYYNSEKPDVRRLKSIISRFRYTLIDTTISRFHNVDELLIIKSQERGNPELALDFMAELSKEIKRITNQDEIELIDLQKGTTKGIFNFDLKAIAEVVEKIIFFIPTWKDKMAEVNRKVKETEMLEAKKNKLIAETSKIESETKINEAKAIIEIFEKYKELGVRQLQLGDKLLIAADERNNFFLSIPENVDKEEDEK